MNISAVLLAGGESRRMGRDKATMLFRQKPLWKVQLDLLRKLEPAEILVSTRSDPVWRPADTQFAGDDAPSRGPLSGIVASLGRMHSRHLLVIAIDMPFLTEVYLRFLCGQIEPRRGVVAKFDDRFEPLATIYPREAEIDFRNALKGADRSLQTVVRSLVQAGKLREISVTEHDKKLFANANEPCDLPAL
jgi:molybdopterin-guanine dinucleotide biosynthesis protein A